MFLRFLHFVLGPSIDYFLDVYVFNWIFHSRINDYHILCAYDKTLNFAIKDNNEISTSNCSSYVLYDSDFGFFCNLLDTLLVCDAVFKHFPLEQRRFGNRSNIGKIHSNYVWHSFIGLRQLRIQLSFIRFENEKKFMWNFIGLLNSQLMRRTNESKKYITTTTSVTLKRENSRITALPLKVDSNIDENSSGRIHDALL